MHLEHKTIRTKVKNSGDRGEVTVLGASFLNIDRGRDLIVPGAYHKHLTKFSQTGTLLIDHKNRVSATAGQVTRSYESQKGLVIKGSFASDEVGQWARDKALEGSIKSVSIGHYVHSEKFANAAEVKQIWANHGYTPNDSDLREIKKGPVRVLLECEPVEVSFVAVPMNDQARVLEVKGVQGIEQKKGATFNKSNRSTLRAVYSLVKQMLSSIKSEEINETLPAKDKPVQGQDAKAVTNDKKTDRPGVLQLKLDLLNLEIKATGERQYGCIDEGFG